MFSYRIQTYRASMVYLGESATLGYNKTINSPSGFGFRNLMTSHLQSMTYAAILKLI